MKTGVILSRAAAKDLVTVTIERMGFFGLRPRNDMTS